MASVTLEHVFKQYGEVTAVKDFNLDVKDKEFIVLVGPSGCGKSTTLRMVAGLEEISDGIIKIGDRVVNDVAPKDRDIAMVFQSYALYPHMNVYDNMAFGLKLRKYPKAEIERRVRETAQMLGIEAYLDRKPKELSGGQRQRVALGRAIVRDPHVFLMDEPLSNLDAKLRVQMRTEITKLHNRLETTVIYVTHDQTEAMTMGDRIVCMKDGVIQQVDTPQRMYEHPANLFVAGFIGSPAMNFIPGRLQVEGEDLFFVAEGMKVKIPAGKAKQLQQGASREVIFGIRPEDIHDEAVFLESAPDAQIDVQIDVTELMGAETYLYFEIAGQQVTARVDARTQARDGERARLALDMNKCHLFDAQTEQAIL
ncbi:MAG: sn-glycerol-3-phosphate ABC transporter ATP-binding protein UgpC [Firmicutes bacterium]|nr:sn-glycerol-3-phosphate ABC transporter ATP-binding protein UgpC [Bacillota bacterium]